MRAYRHVKAMLLQNKPTRRHSALHYVLLWLFVVLAGFARGNIKLSHSSDLTTVLKEGQRQYEIVQEKIKLPDSGQCWRNAVVRLESGCKQLTESLQTELALRFADCFLRSSGQPGIECLQEDFDSSVSRQECLRNLTDRVFHAYTEFYTHSQSMCLFLMSQVWHQETQRTIDKLWTSASDVSKRLEEAGKIQETLLDGQKESLNMQQVLLDSSQHLGNLVHDSASTLAIVFKEFRTTAAEQQQLLSHVFHHLSALQSWIVGEISWVDSLVFYISSSIFTYLITSPRRVSDARFPLFIILLLSAAAERLLASYILTETDNPESLVLINLLKEQLYWWLWLLRRASLILCAAVLGIMFYRYSDQEQQRHQLLLQIWSQNKEMISFIKEKMLANRGLRNSFDVPDSVGYTAVSVSSLTPEIEQLKNASPRPSSVGTPASAVLTPSLRKSYDRTDRPTTPPLDNGSVTPKLSTFLFSSSPKGSLSGGSKSGSWEKQEMLAPRSSDSRESTPLRFYSDESETAQNSVTTRVTREIGTFSDPPKSRPRSRSRRTSPGRKQLSALSARATPYNLRRAVASQERL